MADYRIFLDCDPACPELIPGLFPGQDASDRPDLIARTFKIKLDDLLHELLDNGVLGEVIAHEYVVGRRKGSKPYADILLTVANEYKPQATATFGRWFDSRKTHLEAKFGGYIVIRFPSIRDL